MSRRKPRRIPKKGEPAVLDRNFMEFWTKRTHVNQSIAALLFAQRMARHEIETMRPHLKTLLIREIYPEHVAGRNFNYTLSAASEQLAHADDFLFDVGLVSCQPLYETYLKSVCDLVSVSAGVPCNAGDIPRRHRWLTNRGLDLTGPQLELFDLLRMARNKHVHEGGASTTALENARGSLSDDALSTWKRAAKRGFPAMPAGETIPSGSFNPVATVYAIGNMGVKLNNALVASEIVTRDVWADIAVADYRADAPGGWATNRDGRISKVRGYGDFYFGAALPWITDQTLIGRAVDRAN